MQLYKYTSTKQSLKDPTGQHVLYFWKAGSSNIKYDNGSIDNGSGSNDNRSRSNDNWSGIMIHHIYACHDTLYFWCQRHARLSGQLLNGLQWVAPRSGLLGIFYCWALTASITMSASWLLACILFSRPVPDKRQMRKKSCYRQVVVAPLAFSGIWKQLNWCGAMEPWCPPGQMSRPPRLV